MNINLDVSSSKARLISLKNVNLDHLKGSKIIDIREHSLKSQHIPDISKISSFQAITNASIPLVLNKIAAGFPSPAEDYIDKTVDMNDLLISNKDATFIVQVESLSMKDVGIEVNDYLIVDRSIRSQHYDVVVAFIDNEFTVKRLMITQQMSHHELFDIFQKQYDFKDLPAVWLKPENIEYQPILPRSEQELVIWGVVTKVIKNFK
ncbi:translesion error-prone DNA polymerase V autoproteolytic subunit [Acinetobacter bereziniae]|uniref:LexA family protein n=1 Tax=Acinetobacter bereziniae TaxID=106648 RepID=UPI001580EC71|nr:translesion error-prone DNA polymerase V autoproteolytic subunit [Acinetobacter bereziniae]MBO3656011.1 translesion error-prone DNA polymerase V autoproteolytic subunit [Acinetobacter bereziniae]NUF64863.1 translesion error-prone DNA polymerase V autoproteolytic subunit [Acinetobacter bereziniae]NUG09472.1 translesion error-prone DNA polymerase V autoproteolytic subunit [Acinetobacter bereziniae]NUG65346.1 translesion error-prone DNA polymerase V autoproteolytic subunit [Acinetobacter berezi